ncbi:Uncharacterised protein [Mycobacteroides abscessus subsp. abscessus]|nr:Uncharacterised protein [Mycobacteroides abscessus subsp. abscessus]
MANLDQIGVTRNGPFQLSLKTSKTPLVPVAGQ